MSQSRLHQIVLLEQLAQVTTLPTLATVFLRAAVIVTHWNHRSKSRRALKSLEDHHLFDIGISRDAAKAETEKPFWR